MTAGAELPLFSGKHQSAVQGVVPGASFHHPRCSHKVIPNQSGKLQVRQAMKKYPAIFASLCLASWFAAAQVPAQPSAPVHRTTKAVNYRLRGDAVKVDLHGTELMQNASGEAKVTGKKSSVEIDAKFDNLDDPTKFGLEYLSLVLWAVSPEGRAVNLGELVVDHNSSHVKAITDMQTFGMIVTAEPYFAVNQPGNMVVLENIAPAGSRQENIEARYELLGRGT